MILKKEKERILHQIKEMSVKMKDAKLLEEEANECVNKNVRYSNMKFSMSSGKN